MPFTLQQSTEIVRQYLQADTGDPAVDIIIDSILDASKAPTSYRPYVAAAAVCSSILLRGGIVEADGVKWEKSTEVIAGLLSLQKSFDISENLQVPLGWAVADFRTNMTGERKPILSAMIAP